MILSPDVEAKYKAAGPLWSMLALFSYFWCQYHSIMARYESGAGMVLR